MIHGGYSEAAPVFEPAAIICDYSRVRAGSLVRAGACVKQRARLPARSGLGRVPAEGRGSPGAPARGAPAGPEREAGRAADPPAPRGTARSPVDPRAGRHVLAADEPADHGG